MKGNSLALPGSIKSSDINIMDEKKADQSSQEEKLIVEAYLPADPGPYPQDKPKQNTVRFTPTQVLGKFSFHCPLVETHECIF